MPEIQEYQFGKIVVDGVVHTRDLIILPDKVMSNWWRKEGHQLNVEDLKVVFDAKPELLIIGIGASGMMKVPEETRKALESAGIKIEIAPTGKAWQLYNELREKQHTAGAFHLTC